MTHATWIVGLALALQVPSPNAAEDQAAALRAERQTLREQETAQLQKLAARLKAEGQADIAQEVAATIEPAPPRNGPTRFVPLADVVPAADHGLANLPSQAAPAAKGRTELASIRTQTTQALFDLANRAAKAHCFSLAEDCLRGVLDRDPNHAEARRLLGFVPLDGGWATPYAVEKLKTGHVLHPVFGWVKADWVPHLDRGELPSYADGTSFQWIPAAEADAQRNSIHRPWHIGTEHFAISTDLTLSETISLGRRLEHFHDLFFALLADVIEPDLPLALRFQGSSRSTKNVETTHQVFYFADKQQYVEYLQPLQDPSIAGTLGYYLIPDKAQKLRTKPASFFYKDDGADIDAISTLYHEVSHQLLFESMPKKNDYSSNFWVLEGLGTYFETVRPQPDGSILVGGAIGPRIALVKLRLFEQGGLMPIADLVSMSMSKFQGRGTDVYVNYQMAMALTVFLMQADGGRYRDAFLDYLEDVYRGRIRGNLGRSLEDRMGEPYATLQARFIAFLKAANNDVEAN
jgi:Protein of unknown function (DUF1570)